MFDPASVHDITLGEWLSFWEPLWGKRYVGLDKLRSLSETSSAAVFLMTRTIYDRDGDVMADPEIQSMVTQEMVRADGEWELVMGDDLATDIIAEIGPDETPVPEPAAPESTQPPTTVPETTQPETTSPDAESTSSAPTD